MNIFPRERQSQIEKTNLWLSQRKGVRKLKKTQINGKTPHVHGLEQSILLKWLYHPK